MQTHDDEQLRIAFEIASVGIGQADVRTGRLLRVNREMCRITGYTPEELLGMTFSELTHPDDRQADWEAFQRVVRGESPHYRMEKRYVRKDGSHVWVNVNATIWRDADGAPACGVATIEDISERKRAEAARRESEERLRFALEAGGTGSWDLDLETLEVARDAEHDRIYGYASPLPKWDFAMFLEHVLPEDRKRANRQFRRVIDGRRKGSLECRIRRADGQVRWIRLAGGPLCDANGHVRRLAGILQDITARKHAEAELAASESRFRSLFENMLNGFAYCRMIHKPGEPPDFIYLEVNRAFGTLTGLRNVVGRRVTEVIPGIHETDRDLLDTYDRVVRTGVPEQMEVHVEALKMWFSISLYRTEPNHFVAVFDVITGRKRTEMELRELNQQLELRVRERAADALDLFNKAPCGYHSLAADGLILKMNDTELGWLGYRRDEVEGRMNFRDLLAPASAKRFPEVFQAFVRDGGDVSVEWDMCRKDGGTFPVLITATAVRAADGSFLQTRTTVLDITARRNSELQLRLLSSAVEQVPAVVVITDAAGSIEYVNPQFERQTGYQAAEALGKNPRFLQSGAHPREFFEHMWSTLLAGQVWRGELCNKRKDGSLFWESTAIAPVRDCQGGTTHYVAIKEDITELRRAAEELRRAKEQADAANQAKSRFLANMSHEIRTPLNAVLGFSQLMLADATLSSDQRHRLSTIWRSGEHLLSIINDILELARIESGRSSLNRAPFDLHQIMDDLARLFGQRAASKDLRFRVRRHEDVPRFVVGDETKLRQVLINLLGNSVKFTPAGGEVTLHLRADDAADVLRLHALVEDSGPGIDPQDLPHLFEPFFQCHAGRQSDGTGLGLPISREFVRLMGGELHAGNRPGGGSVFGFDLRVELADETFVPPETQGAPPVLLLRPGQPECRVLAVDDHAVNLEFLDQLLTPLGFPVRTVDNGAAAVALSAEWRPRIALVDLRMPGMDGRETIRRLRAAHGGQIGIIVLSAVVFESDRRDALNCGADAFLAKPFRSHDLLGLISALVGVEYLRAEDAPTDGAPADSPAAGAAGCLPAYLLEAMDLAARRAEYDELLALTERIATHDEALARGIRGLVERFDYQAIRELASRS